MVFFAIGERISNKNYFVRLRLDEYLWDYSVLNCISEMLQKVTKLNVYLNWTNSIVNFTDSGRVADTLYFYGTHKKWNLGNNNKYIVV